MNVEKVSSCSSDEDSSYDDEIDNDTILEAPSIMEQTVYDDGTSQLTRQITKKFDGS